jgi:hypothetical protein
MINLRIQVISIVISYLYGIFFSIMLNVNSKYIYNEIKKKRLLFNFLFVFDNILLYFIILRYVNEGILHYYFIIALILGFLSVNKMTSRIFNKLLLLKCR